MSDELKFDYKPSLLLMAACSILFGGCSVLFLYKCIYSANILVINHLIELSPSSARAFWGILALPSIAFTGIGLVGILTSMQKPKVIRLTGNEIFLPKNVFSQEIVYLPLSNIASISERTLNSNVFLELMTHNKKRYSIQRSMTRTKDEYSQLKDELVSRWGKVKEKV